MGFPNLVLLWNLNLQIRLKTSIIQKVIHNLYSNSPNILCVTSQFHILRGMKFTHTNRMKVDGIGSHTPYHFFDVALVRDFLALMYQYKLLLTIYFAFYFCFSFHSILKAGVEQYVLFHSRKMIIEKFNYCVI